MNEQELTHQLKINGLKCQQCDFTIQHYENSLLLIEILPLLLLLILLLLLTLLLALLVNNTKLCIV